MNGKPSCICKWCNQPSVIIWVRGHDQYLVCGINIDECCRGEETHPSTLSRSEEVKDKND